MPRLYVIVGPNGSGKSSIITGTGLDSVCRSIINPDNYARRLTSIPDEMERYRIALDECGRIRTMLMESGADFGMETVGSGDDKLDFISRAKDQGYTVNLLFVTTGNPDINVSRVMYRAMSGGHDVPEDKIRSRYARTMSRLGRYLELADEAVVIDNGGEHPVVVLLKDGDGIGFPSVVPDWLKEHVPDNPVN